MLRPIETAGLVCLILAAAASSAEAARRPNVIFVLIDDLGFGDLGCTGNRDVPTPNIDRLAGRGTLFTQFYVASPICSPSRVAFTTGQYPQRWGIHSYLNSRAANAQRKMADFLDPKAPAVARAFQKAGYATAHFGKWHMGGGRDVGDAPLPPSYGFDESLVSFEGLGDRILPPGGLSEQSAKLGRGKITRVAKHEQTGIYVDRAIDFIERHRGEPFYLHLWLNDVHDAHVPRPDYLAKYECFAANAFVQKFYAVLDQMDHELGRLFDAVDRLALAESTLVLLTGDNGPTAWASYYKAGFEPPGSTAGDRGRKWSLYEGGIRQPLIAQWKGTVPAGRTDRTSLITAVDFFPTLAALAGVPTSGVSFDGEDMSAALLGKEFSRSRPIIWDYRQDIKPGKPSDVSPLLAVREERFKLLMDPDGSRAELYDLAEDAAESRNLIAQPEHAAVLERLKQELDRWIEQRDAMDVVRPAPARDAPNRKTESKVTVHRGLSRFFAAPSAPSLEEPLFAAKNGTVPFGRKGTGTFFGLDVLDR